MRFFEIILTNKWIEDNPVYISADNHLQAMNQINKNAIRIFNKKFREIEKTGKYYRVMEQKKGGKSFIYELK